LLTTTSRYFPDELSQWPQYLKNEVFHTDTC